MLARPTASRALCEEAPMLIDRARGSVDTIGQKALCESHLQDSDPIHLLPLGFLRSWGGVEKGNEPWDPRQYAPGPPLDDSTGWGDMTRDAEC